MASLKVLSFLKMAKIKEFCESMGIKYAANSASPDIDCANIVPTEKATRKLSGCSGYRIMEPVIGFRDPLKK
jgi:hypothetical protein